ncbi:MAG: sodium/proline symporter [Deltaproteobacteria bacterium]|nr:sodium/proline symporter [Deltaproteobacteria bacterium]
MLTVFVLYLVVLMVISVWTARMSKTSADYIAGGKKVGGVAMALSERATGESAWLILGLTGEAYLLGVQALWFALGCVAGIFFIWFVMGDRLRRAAEASGSLTITSLIARRFPGAERLLSSLASLVIIFFLLFYIEAQFYGGGKVLYDTFGIPQIWGVVIGSLIVVFYCMLGGFITVVATDVLQAVLMIVSLVVMPILLLVLLASYDLELAASLHKAGESYVSLTGGETGMAAVLLVASGLSWALGYTGQPQLLTRLMLVRSRKDYDRGKWVAGAWTLVAYTGAMLIGFVGIAFVQGGLIGGDAVARLSDTPHKGFELIFPVLVNAFMLPVVAGIMLSGAVSAMMSTASAEIILCSSTITEDLHGRFARKKMEGRRALWFNRIVTLAVGLAAFLLALTVKDSVFGLVSYAWSGIGSSFGPALLLILFWKRVSRAGVVASLVSGTVGTMVWKYFFEKDTGVSERLTSFVFAFAMAVLFSLLLPERKAQGATPPAAPAAG